MSSIESELKKRGELVVDASLIEIRTAAGMTLGTMNESREDDTVVFTARSAVCPSQIKAREISEDRYHVYTTSICNIKDCTYWLECVRLDNSRLDTFISNIEKLTGRRLKIEMHYGWESGLAKEDEKLKGILERVLERKREKV